MDRFVHLALFDGAVAGVHHAVGTALEHWWAAIQVSKIYSSVVTQHE